MVNRVLGPARDATAAPQATPCELAVYFDGGCPVCSREIAFYRRLSGAERISWVDARHCAPEVLGAGLERETALARFHVRRGDGALVSGGAAFVEVWACFPAWAWLSRLAGLPPVQRGLELAYEAFLRLRKLWTPRKPEANSADQRRAGQ